MDTVVNEGCAVDVLVETTTEDDSCVVEELGLGAAIVDGGADEEDGDATVLELVAGLAVLAALLAVEEGGGVPVTRIVPFCNTGQRTIKTTNPPLHVGKHLRPV